MVPSGWRVVLTSVASILLVWSLIGCHVPTGALDSNLVGNWRLVEGKEILVYSDLAEPVEEDTYEPKTGNGGVPDLVIRLDGSFDLTQSIYQWDGLRKAGDRFTARDSKSRPGHIEVVCSRYTEDSSEIVLCFGGSARETADLMTFCATLAPDGMLHYRQVTHAPGYLQVLMGRLRRFATDRVK